MTVIFLLLLLLPTIHSQSVPSPQACPTPTNTSQVCEYPLICLTTTFPNPYISSAANTTCTTLPFPAPECSVESCATRGGTAICTISNVTTTCTAWSLRLDNGPLPDCTLNCTAACPADVYASNGELFCTACTLMEASCRARFEFYGPVLPMQSEGFCSSGTKRSPKYKCKRGEICVVSEFGDEEKDIPDEGRCEKRKKGVRKCTVDQCTSTGGGSVCRIGKRFTTCKSWANEGGLARCERIRCSGRCLRRGVVGSDGIRYCSWCGLKKSSCESGFRITRLK